MEVAVAREEDEGRVGSPCERVGRRLRMEVVIAQRGFVRRVGVPQVELAFDAGQRGRLPVPLVSEGEYIMKSNLQVE